MAGIFNGPRFPRAHIIRDGPKFPGVAEDDLGSLAAATLRGITTRSTPSIIKDNRIPRITRTASAVGVPRPRPRSSRESRSVHPRLDDDGEDRGQHGRPAPPTSCPVAYGRSHAPPCGAWAFTEPKSRAGRRVADPGPTADSGRTKKCLEGGAATPARRPRDLRAGRTHLPFSLRGERLCVSTLPKRSIYSY